MKFKKEYFLRQTLKSSQRFIFILNDGLKNGFSFENNGIHKELYILIHIKKKTATKTKIMKNVQSWWMEL